MTLIMEICSSICFRIFIYWMPFSSNKMPPNWRDFLSCRVKFTIKRESNEFLANKDFSFQMMPKSKNVLSHIIFYDARQIMGKFFNFMKNCSWENFIKTPKLIVNNRKLCGTSCICLETKKKHFFFAMCWCIRLYWYITILIYIIMYIYIFIYWY